MTLRARKLQLALALAGILLLVATPALADEYDADSAGHPLRIAAYVLHPVGVALEWLLFRPAHWLGSKEPLATIFGHEDETPVISRSDGPPPPRKAIDPAPHP